MGLRSLRDLVPPYELHAALMHFPAVAFGGAKHYHRNRRMPATIIPRPIRPEYVKRGGKSVGLRSRRGDHGDRQRALGRLAAARIEDVAIAPAAMSEGLMLRAGSAKCAIMQFDLARRARRPATGLSRRWSRPCRQPQDGPPSPSSVL